MGKDQDALGLHEAGTPVLVIKAVDANAAAASTGRVNEPVTADVDTGMADLTAPTVVEKDHVARLQLAAFDLRCFQIDHFAGRAWQLDAGLLAKQKTDETTAIKAGFRGAATVAVRGAHQREAALKHAIGQSWQLVALVIGEFTKLLLGGFVCYGLR